ncbi:MAG: hypothetical protein MUE44_16135 [Oscillatoriaceae cyanobacterium Prado104]|jgi:hypothetical protein|nr:hypothetical protein [Oscillatoriaceae cyanobacterium Prado104]
MNLSPALQRAIEQIASSQGISAEQFIIRTLIEKISSLQKAEPTVSTSQTGLREEDGILVFNTESVDGIDFNALIAQSREERTLEQMGL